MAVYRLAGKILNRVPQSGRLGESLAGRRQAVDSWIAHGRSRPSRRPVVWFHAASVGESLAAGPVIRRLRVAAPGAEILLTYSSPSVSAWREKLDVDAADFAPPEEPRAVATVFNAIRPDLLVFSRSDLWPEMLVAASQRKTPIAVIGGTVRQRSARMRWPVRTFLRGLFRHLDFVGAVSAEDAERWIRLGAAESAVAVTGDPRHDQVIEQTTDLAAIRSVASWATGKPTLVAGSVEPEDEMALLAAFVEVRRAFPEARVLVVPHDPSGEAVHRIADTSKQMEVDAQVLEKGQDPVASCLIFPGTGMLSSLYSVGSLSYVGGGFRPGGLHAVIEPAAYGIPVIIGPEFRWSGDARAMVSSGGAVSLTTDDRVGALASCWIRWLRYEEERSRAGLSARKILSPGAAGRSARQLLSLLAG
jgi:3-deoxy-D-manno-octulosonic-acid transferase